VDTFGKLLSFFLFWVFFVFSFIHPIILESDVRKQTKGGRRQDVGLILKQTYGTEIVEQNGGEVREQCILFVYFLMYFVSSNWMVSVHKNVYCFLQRTYVQFFT